MSERAERDTLAEVLAAHEGITFDLGTPREYTQHGGWNQSCACGEPLGDAGGDDGDERVATAHRAHPAAVLAERDRRVAVEAVVRNFADFLTAMADAGIRPAKPGEPRTPEAAAKARAIYLQHYPDERTIS